MKQFLLMSLLVLMLVVEATARIWRVNNVAGISADFTSAQDANDAPAVMPGDTIHLEPSSLSYGVLICTKRLTWISTGEFLNVHTGEQFSLNAGHVSSVNIVDAAAANSVFHIAVQGGVNIGAAGVRLERCFVYGVVQVSNAGNPVTDVVILNCYSKSELQIGFGSNVVVSNCIFEGALYVYVAATEALISHCVFNAVATGPGIVDNTTLVNSIFNKASVPYLFTNCQLLHNMSGAPDVLPAGNGNQNNVDMSLVFVNHNGNTDADFALKPGSPAKAAGTGNPPVDLGAYGGSMPFKIALQPAIPAIYKIQPPAVPVGNTMPVILSTRSHN